MDRGKGGGCEGEVPTGTGRDKGTYKQLPKPLLGMLSGSQFDPQPQRLMMFHLNQDRRSESLVRQPDSPYH